MLNESFKQALSDSVQTLQELPRQRALVEDSRARFRRFRSSHPGVHCDLLVDQPPGSETVDYDILLSGPDGGTVAVTWRPDQGLPWTVQYSDHWAANYVLSVNELHVSIQSALIYLDTSLNRRPHLAEDLINQLLIQEAMNESPPTASGREIEKAVDDFRIHRGLYSAADTSLWLEKMSLTMEALRELLAQKVLARKLKKRVTASQAMYYFEAHRQDFDLLTLLRVWAPSKSIAVALGKAGRRSDLWTAINKRGLPLPSLNGELATVFARELPPAFASAAPRTIIGAERAPGGYQVGQVLQRRAARFDDRTRNTIEDLLFQEWLAERRKRATVRWHWL